MAAVTNEYNLGVPEEVLSDHFDYMDVDYAYSLGETCFRLEPRVGPPSGEQSCHLRNMNSMYSEEKYGEARDPPLLVGELQFPEVFEELSFSAVDVLIKRAGDNTYHVPVEMSCLREAIQLAADFFHSNNPDAARDFYCYVRPSTTAVPPQGCQRYKWIHADGLLGPKHRNADDVAPLDVATHDFTKFFEKNVDKSKALTPQKAYQLACFDGYTLHRSPINRTDQRVLRKFVTINFAPYLYDGWGTINLHFREVYQTPVYYCREMLAWLPGGDWGRQQIEVATALTKKREKEAEMKRMISDALKSGSKPWNRGKIMIVGEGRAGKSALANSMIGKEFVDTASTIGIQSLVCDIHYTRENNGSWAAGTRAEKELEAGIADMIATALSQPAEKHAAQTVPAEKAGSKNKRKGEAGGRHAAAVEAAAPPVPDVDHELVMKCYDENMQVSSADLRIAIFDYGGQSVFNVVHHLFLTQFGVYVAVFNMEWFLTNDEILETSLGYLRFWLNSIVVHTINADTNVTAPIYLVGTRKDTVTNSADHVKVSNLLASRFSHHRAWTSVIFPPAADTVDALCFFAVNNVLGRGDEEVLRLSASIEATMKAMPSTRQIVPLPWLAALDELQAAGTGSFSLTAATEIAVNAGVAPVDIVSWLSFLKEMGILLWLDETGLRDIVIMDAISFLVAPATLIICQHTALSAFEATVHQEAVHRECAQRYPSDWIALVQSALLSERLLPVLWQKYWSHKDKLLMLMTKYGLLVPFFQSEEEESAGIARTHLVPSLLPQFDINIREYSQWSDDAYHSCMFVFTVISEFENYSKISAADLDLCGFLPSGLFERVVGKAVSWCQTTSRNGMFNIRNAVLFRNLSVLYYGNQRFRLTLCQNLNCIRLDVEGDAPLVVHNRIFDQISSIIAECMSSLRCFTALVCNTTAHTSTHADLDLFSFAELSRGEAVELCLIPLRLLNHSVINDSALITTVGSLVRKLLSAQDVKRLYEPWLQMPFMQRDKYDIFISYRWNDDDQALVSAMFDAFTNYSFPGERARAIEVFLDTKRLVQGRRFDFDFVKAICHSKLVMPILSYAALELMSNHNPEKVDNMLLEWILAMECFQVEQGALKGIFPLTIGERKGDSIEGKTATKFLSAKALNLLPHVVPTKTLQEAEIHLQKFGLFVSDAAAREKFHARNVYEIVDSLMKFLYFDISSLSPNFVVAESTQKAVSTLEVLCRNSSVMEEKPISHEIVASIVERSIKPQPGLDKVEEDAWKILTNKLCHSLADEDFVQSRLHDLGIYESKMILKLSDKLIDDITSSLKPVPQKKTIAYLKMLKDFPSSTVDSNSDDQLNEIWRLMTDDRFIVSGKASEVAEILDEQGVVDASFLSDLDEDILSQIASKLKAVPCFKVITALLPPK